MPKAAFLAYVRSNEEGSTQHGLSYTARPPADVPQRDAANNVKSFSIFSFKRFYTSVPLYIRSPSISLVLQYAFLPVT
jgi:hypothetical protein